MKLSIDRDQTAAIHAAYGISEPSEWGKMGTRTRMQPWKTILKGRKTTMRGIQDWAGCDGPEESDRSTAWLTGSQAEIDEILAEI